jgi:hypothetical protein
LRALRRAKVLVAEHRSRHKRGGWTLRALRRAKVLFAEHRSRHKPAGKEGALSKPLS